MRKAIKEEEEEKKRMEKHLTHLFKILNRKKKYFKSYH